MHDLGCRPIHAPKCHGLAGRVDASTRLGVVCVLESRSFGNHLHPRIARSEIPCLSSFMLAALSESRGELEAGAAHLRSLEQDG